MTVNLDALADLGRGFHGIVKGEPHRAFSGNQFDHTLPLFIHYGVETPHISGSGAQS